MENVVVSLVLKFSRLRRADFQVDLLTMTVIAHNSFPYMFCSILLWPNFNVCVTQCNTLWNPMNYGIILDPALQGMGRRSLNVRRFDPCKHSSRGILRKIRARILTELKYLLTQLNFEQDRMLHTDDRPPINLSFRYIIMIFPSSDRTLADFGH